MWESHAWWKGGHLNMIRRINCLLDLWLLLKLMSLQWSIHFFGVGIWIPHPSCQFKVDHVLDFCRLDNGTQEIWASFECNFEGKYPHNESTYPQTRANINKGHSWPLFFPQIWTFSQICIFLGYFCFTSDLVWWSPCSTVFQVSLCLFQHLYPKPSTIVMALLWK